MLRFSTLGSLRLVRDEGADLAHAISQPKRLALLAYLAVNGGGKFHRRDTLVGMLWPELPQDRARAALRKALHYLRSSLGAEVIRTRGDEEVALDSSLIECDACEFERLAKCGEHRRALEIYAGELLPGLHVSDAPDFEQWLDRERLRLRNAAIQCAISESRRLAAMRAYADATRFARRAVEIAPLEEMPNQILITVLLEAGDRSAAVLAYNLFADRLRREFDLEPSEGTSHLVERARKDGAAPGISPPETAGSSSDPPLGDGPADGGRKPKHRRIVGIKVGVAAAIGIALVATSAWAIHRHGNRRDVGAVVMFPLHLAPSDSAASALAEGAVDLFNAVLADDSLSRAIDSRISLAAWKRKVRETRREPSTSESLALARDIGANRVVLAELLSMPGGVTATGRVLRAADGKLIAQYVEQESSLSVALVTRLVTRLAARITGESSHRLSGVSDSVSAVTAYLAGMRAYRLGLDDDAYREFSRALDIDSTFAIAALWRSYAARMSIGGDVVAADVKAWSLRGRLSRRDRSLLSARFAIGPNYPKPSTDAELIDAAARAAQANPDRAEALADWGRLMLQDGPLTGIANSREQAAAILDSAIALDSSLSVALDLRLWTAVELGNRADIRRLYALYVQLNPHAELIDLEHWMVARALGDSVGLAHVRTRFPEFPNELVRFMAAHSAVIGTSLADAESVIHVQAARGKLKPDWQRELLPILATRGRVAAATALADTIFATQPPPAGVMQTVRAARMLIEVALADSGYASAAAEASRRLEALASTIDDEEVRATAACYSAIWRTSQGDTTRARNAIVYIRSVSRKLPFGLFGAVGQLDVCPRFLEAQLASLRTPFQSSPALDSLEALMRRGVGFELPGNLANLMIARWREGLGDYPQGLNAVRRTMHALPGATSFTFLRPAFLREEGRLAALVGDTSGAVHAYRAYLAMRDQPDSGAMRDEVTHVQSLLTALESATRRRSRQ